MRRYSLAALVAALAIFLGCWPAHADPVLTPSLGANSISYSNGLPSDFELGATGAISLSPHISAVGGAWYGVGRSYFRGTVGARVTATDVDDKNFSIGLGAQYNASTNPSIRPQEWDLDATAGWRPYPEHWPLVTLVAQGAYGLDSQTTYLMLGARYALRPF